MSLSSPSAFDAPQATAVNKRKRNPWELRSLNNVIIDSMVGSGTFGDVFKAIDRETREVLALKKIKINSKVPQGFPVTTIREIRILKSLDHENIVKLKEMIVAQDEDDEDGELMSQYKLSKGDIFMVFEYVPFDLSGLLKTKEANITEMHIKSYLKQLLKGIHHLHLNKILHRDIKPANILITSNNVLKIADWGLARTYMNAQKQNFTNPVVTLWYRSPELVLGTRHYGSEVDIWSVGCLFCELKTRVAPLQAPTEIQQLEKIYQLLGSPTGELKEKYSQYPDYTKYTMTKEYQPRLRDKFEFLGASALDLLERMFDMNPETRINASDALDSNYLWENIIPEPHLLPRFDHVLNLGVTEYLVKEKHKEEKQKQIATEKALLEKKERERNERFESIKSNNSSNKSLNNPMSKTFKDSKQPLIGFNSAPRGPMGRGRGHLPTSSKYKIIEPSNNATNSSVNKTTGEAKSEQEK